MVVIVTRMRDIPAACVACKFYRAGTRSRIYLPGCGAVSAFQPDVKVIDETDPGFVRPTRGRQKWCPLRKTGEIRE